MAIPYHDNTFMLLLRNFPPNVQERALRAADEGYCVKIIKTAPDPLCSNPAPIIPYLTLFIDDDEVAQFMPGGPAPCHS